MFAKLVSFVKFVLAATAEPAPSREMLSFESCEVF